MVFIPHDYHFIFYKKNQGIVKKEMELKEL